jgi:hypothetical protein
MKPKLALQIATVFGIDASLEIFCNYKRDFKVSLNIILYELAESWEEKNGDEEKIK